MSPQKICNWAKFGFCRLKEECKDFHPKELCLEKLCIISKCMKRHPKLCIYFKTRSCKYGDFCQYSHNEEPNVVELQEKVIKLEGEN